mmetsp:Transcript_10958/g.18745  ORF Transcript_10958/g.18745 Transcript_10958/m.18745 type:complete len:322 (+) Transcript_10958:337-1302(+)
MLPSALMINRIFPVSLCLFSLRGPTPHSFHADASKRYALHLARKSSSSSSSPFFTSCSGRIGFAGPIGTSCCGSSSASPSSSPTFAESGFLVTLLAPNSEPEPLEPKSGNLKGCAKSNGFAVADEASEPKVNAGATVDPVVVPNVDPPKENFGNFGASSLESGADGAVDATLAVSTLAFATFSGNASPTSFLGVSRFVFSSDASFDSLVEPASVSSLFCSVASETVANGEIFLFANTWNGFAPALEVSFSWFPSAVTGTDAELDPEPRLTLRILRVERTSSEARWNVPDLRSSLSPLSSESSLRSSLVIWFSDARFIADIP